MSTADAGAIAARMKRQALDVFIVLRSSAMRPREAYSMRWEFINWEAAQYCNPKGKTPTARRKVPLLDV